MSLFCFIKVLPFSGHVNAFGAGRKKFGAIHKISNSAEINLVKINVRLTQKGHAEACPFEWFLIAAGQASAPRSRNRIRIAAVSERFALPCGTSVVAVRPVMRPSAFAHCMAFSAHALMLAASV